MAKRHNSNRPRLTAQPSASTPRTAAAAPSNSELFTYRLKAIDHEGQWGWQTIKEHWQEIIKKLDDYQNMTWSDILSAAGGRSHGTNNHPISVKDLNKCAERRLAELDQDDLEEIFSLRLTGTQRIYGIRRNKFLDIMWFDPHHGDSDKCVCRSKKKGT